MYLDWPKHFITNRVATKSFFIYRTFMDMGCPIDDGLISTIDLVIEFDLATRFCLHSNKM
jgi:hypothetical protein